MASTEPHSQILIVEDDADLSDMIAQLLAVEGFSASTVGNGREALEYLRRLSREKQ